MELWNRTSSFRSCGTCSSSSKREFIEVELTELAEVFNIIAHMKFVPEFINLQIVNNNVYK